MTLKAQMGDTKAVETLSDGTQQAAFQYDFFLGEKAVAADVDENGDLWIQGYASDFCLDRQEEMFEPGAFERGLKAYMESNPIMLYHHQFDKALGQFTKAFVDDTGLWVEGRINAPAPGSWAEDVFNKIRRGTIKAFSVGGFFRRRGNKIFDCDLAEISVTPLGINSRASFEVVAKKAFENIEVKAETASVVEEVEEETEIVEPVVITPPEEIEVTEEPVLITAEQLAKGSVGVEHLDDDLRGRFQEFQPEAPSVEEAHAKLGELTAQLSTVFDHIGLKLNGTDARLP